ncbi:MAG: FAD-dependent oxidoreductase, partial [Caulobacteraceae bacterium]
MGSENAPQGPDLAHGVADADLADGAMVLGHVGEEAVLLARRGKEIFALGATCTHYGGPLAEGVMEGETVRCPWHHACFALRTGEALAAPALSPVKCFEVRREGGRILVGAEKAGPSKSRRSTLERVVIVGGGAAGFAAAEMLRRSGFEGSLCMVSDDADPPCDRPNLSKDYLAGTAPEEWIPLREPAFYEENAIALRLGLGATSLDVESRRLTLATGEILPYDKLLLATGAEPIRLAVPGSDLRHVRTLR